LSNVLAAIGRAQLEVLPQRVARRRAIFAAYERGLGDLPGIGFMPEAPWGRSSRWLTVITVDPTGFGEDRETVRQALEAENIESRPAWKPMHLQPVFSCYEKVGGAVAEALFDHGLCLPSGSALGDDDLARIVQVIRQLHGRA